MKNRMLVFVAIFLAILGFGAFYVSSRLGEGLLARVLIAFPFAFVAVASIVMRAMFSKSESALARAVLFANGIAMGWTSFAFVAAFGRDILLGPPAALGWIDYSVAFGLESNILALTGSVLALAWGLFGGLRGPRIREVAIELRALPPEFEGFTIAQISDLHVGSSIRERFVRAVVQRVNALNVDAVALTGDIVDGPSQTLKKHAAPLSELRPRGRVYYVPGNHEYYWDYEEWFAEFRRNGFCLLMNEGVAIMRGTRSLWIAGVVDPSAGYRGATPAKPNPRAALAGGGADADARILLSHQPSATAADARDAGYDLQLSGHTHGGQFFPWTLAVRKIQRYYLGSFREGTLQIYVSPGTGSWGPPVRFGTRTEITVITLRRATAT